MLKKKIKYENWDGEEEEEVHYFNLSKPELLKMQVEIGGGFGNFLQRISETRDEKQLVTQFERIIMMSYGVRSDDGKRFMKSDELRQAFMETRAYEALHEELTTDADKAAEFIKGILPKEIAAEVDKGDLLRAAQGGPMPPKR
jgi:hypothetical protein